MQTEWRGYYFDGQTSLRQPVTVRITPTALIVIPDTGVQILWPYEEVRQTQGFYAGEQIRLEKGGELSEALFLTDTAFLTTLRRFAPQYAGQFHDPHSRRWRVQLTIFAALLVIGISTALYFWGIPTLVTFITPHVPVAWEEQLGEVVVTQLAPPEHRCTESQDLAAIETILSALRRALPNQPYTFRIVVVNDPTVNAFAAPGGYIVIMRGLLEHTKSAEELAGVLAHEMQHVLQRHSTRAVLQYASIGLLFTVITGDTSGVLSYGLEGARVLSVLRYSRQSEEEADEKGLRLLLKAQIDPAGMIAFFSSLAKDEGDVPAVFAYLSTHPATEDRIKKLQAAAPRTKTAKKLLPLFNWSKMKDVCPSAVKK